MQGQAREYDNIFLFDIVQPTVGFAKFDKVYKRNQQGSRKAALGEIRAIPPLRDWTDVTTDRALELLDMRFVDMRFAPSTRVLVFVRLPDLGDETETVFGRKVAFDLGVIPRGRPNLVQHKERHNQNNGLPTLCSFVLALPEVAEVGARHEITHRISRFPIVFDFVDRSDGISPIFKQEHRHKASAGANGVEKKDRGHGGIHPKNASSLILLG